VKVIVKLIVVEKSEDSETFMISQGLPGAQLRVTGPDDKRDLQAAEKVGVAGAFCEMHLVAMRTTEVGVQDGRITVYNVLDGLEQVTQ